jgi:negative regulator of sigma E activity
MTDAEFEVRARFESLRDLERRSVPDFQDVAAEARAAGRFPARQPAAVSVGLAAAACVVLVATVLVQRSSRASGAAESVTSWRSPTTSLVPTSGQAVLAPPPLLSSVLDGATASTLWRKGD